MKNIKTILMAVGSSGGHIYPAAAISEKLKETTEKQIQSLKTSSVPLKIHFVHSGSSIGKNIFSGLNIPIHDIPIGGLAKGQSFFKKVKTLFLIPKAFIQAFILIRKTKAQVVFGTGGAVTGPVLMMASLMGRKTAIWEANTVMGLANKCLAPFMSHIFTVFPETANQYKRKCTVCSYPLRENIKNNLKNTTNKQSYEENKKYFPNIQTNQQVNPELFKVLILGGSQGSFLLNQVVSKAIEEIEWRKGIFIYHQTGEKHFNTVKEKYKNYKGVEAFPFSSNIQEYYKSCDLIFSRAGSGAIWEIAFHEKPLVLIPLTHSAGGHQLKNAIELSSKNRVEMIKEKDFNVTSFKEKLLELQHDQTKRKQIAQNLKESHGGDGAQQIANWILQILK